MKRVYIHYSDGQYTLSDADADHWTLDVFEIDSRDWERYVAFRRTAFGWDAFLRDLDQTRDGRSEAYGPYTSHKGA